MRQRSPNQKAVGKLTSFIFEVRGRLANNEKVNFSQLMLNHSISKSTLSVLRKLSYIIDGETGLQWSNPNSQSDRIIALRILEVLRQQTDKQSDKPISDLWVAEINSIKSLLSEIRSNTKDRATGLKSASITERVYIAGQIANGYYTNGLQGDKMEITNDFIILATDDLLKKLNHGKE
jgi:hypothetical protein